MIAFNNFFLMKNHNNYLQFQIPLCHANMDFLLVSCTNDLQFFLKYYFLNFLVKKELKLNLTSIYGRPEKLYIKSELTFLYSILLPGN